MPSGGENLAWGKAFDQVLAQGQLRAILAPLGPHPESNLFGVRVAIAMLLKSTDPGWYANYQQFESLWKL
jgi:hypothetical protein